MRVEGLSVGRVVHYMGRGDRCLAAVIVNVWSQDGMVNLAVFTNAAELQSHTSVSYNSENDNGTWHWPERV